ncbi:PREDICTED: thioredoxin-2-like [Priapulus caudatus]|uniref:Thioredoxin-2-like n=1 Tax=Priapulus caudatus TaxID=37621 RepID=A0ABM1F2G1_PRICU|nr:PREDICTED: thioredoxin-2-like [Priapulus caudatus]
MPMVKEINSPTELETALKEAGGKLVVIDFYADWCGPCKQIAPKILAMSDELSDVVFLKVNVDDCDEIAADYDVSAMPTFVFLKDGKKVDNLIGANVDQLKSKIASNK